MIVGVGTDLCHITRIAEAWQSGGERFVQRLLGPDERPLFEQRSEHEKPRFLAKRFAAKEAVGKALGTGVAVPATLHNVQIINDERGAPKLLPGPLLAPYLQQRGLAVHLSITDETDLALAFCVVEQRLAC